MNLQATKRDLIRGKLHQLGALGVLLVLGGLSLAGPYGLLAWGENRAALENRHKHIAELQAERAELENRVALLNPQNVDPDLATELVRRDLNVAHPDEYVLELEPAR